MGESPEKSTAEAASSRQDDRSRRFLAAVYEVLGWSRDGLVRRHDTHDYTCMCAAMGEVALLGAETPHLDTLLRVVETGDNPREVWNSWEGCAAFAVWHARANVGLGGDGDPAEPLADRLERARAARRLAVRRGADMERRAIQWFGSSRHRGVLVEGQRGDPEVLLPWDEVEEERLRAAGPAACCASRVPGEHGDGCPVSRAGSAP